jgi:hypothetical protein
LRAPRVSSLGQVGADVSRSGDRRLAEPEELVTEWRTRAQGFRRHGVESVATTIEVLAAELEATIWSERNELLTLANASRVSGLSVETLGRLIRQGKLPNAGRKFAPRLRRGDLPIRPRNRDVAPSHPAIYDPVADARSLRERRLHSGGEHGKT